MSITDNQDDKGQGKQGEHQGQVARNQQGHGQNEVKGQRGQAPKEPIQGQEQKAMFKGQKAQGKQDQQGSIKANKDTENEDESDQ